MSKKSRDQRKRMRVKKQEQAAMNKVDSDKILKQESTKKARIEALNYLVLFARHKAKLKSGEPSDCWKFNKTRQVWLLKNCYSLEKLPPKHFKIFIKYVQTVKGEQARNDALQLIEAKTADGQVDFSKIHLDAIEQSLINEESEKEKSLGEALQTKIISTKLKRAGQVADALS